MDKVLALDGAELLFGLHELEGHSIPSCYGAMAPTAVKVPLRTMLRSAPQLNLPEPDEHGGAGAGADDMDPFALCTKEVFAPFQIVTTYADEDVDLVVEALERMHNHLTAAIVSDDVAFQRRLLAATVNGTTYVGLKARTTGAPQNHWFGPAGDPRAAGIGTPEAIRLVWSCHREVIVDAGPVQEGWAQPPPS